ncbi:MAG: MEMO1 family protein [Dehalococcoidales bacterium]|nr:MEMO1 family protein [Dehalococcoidales bacterium]
MDRKPAVAGQFYPASASKLRAMIKSMVDEKVEKRDAIGLVLPHAGYVYSGSVAGATLSRVNLKPTVIIMGPNHTGLGKPFSIMTGGTWKTPLGNVQIDSGLAKKVQANSKHLQEDFAAHQMEHSIEVQLPFLQYFQRDFKLVPIVLAHAAGDFYREIGLAIAKAVKELDREVVIIASSDMTHYEPKASAAKKDTKAIAAILELDADKLLDAVQEFNISMCGYGPVAAMIAAAKELGATSTDLVRYQSSGDVTGDNSAVVGYAGIIVRAVSPLVELAKETVESYVREGRVHPPEELTDEMKGKAGVFVSIHRLGALRGCIGTTEAQQDNVAGEIMANAVSAATRDPRFPPVTPDELDDLDYSVDVLTKPEPIDSPDKLDPKRYGVIVEAKDGRRGLLLPDLEGVDTVDYQIAISRQKAGIGPDEPVKLYRFEVRRHE